MVLPLLLALAAAPDVPRITKATLEGRRTCLAQVASRPPQGRLENFADHEARVLADQAKLTDPVVQQCGFASRAQFDRFALRLNVAETDLADQNALREHPPLQELEKKLAEKEAALRKQRDAGTLARDELDALRAQLESVKSAVGDAAHRQKTRARLFPKSLDPRSYADPKALETFKATLDEMVKTGATTAASRDAQVKKLEAELKFAAAEAATQPPLSKEELEALEAFRR